MEWLTLLMVLFLATYVFSDSKLQDVEMEKLRKRVVSLEEDES